MTTVTVVEDEITLNLYDGASPASVADVASDLADHEGDTENPHSVTAAQVGADESGSAATVASDLGDHEALSTTAHGGIVADSDSRLTDARTPTGHAASHATGEDDAVAPADIGAEPGLGNPATDGFVLSSTIAGIRTWIEMAAGGGGDVEEAPEDGTPYSRQDGGWVAALRTNIANTWSAVQTFSAGIVTGIIKPSVNATDAIKITNAAGTAVMTVDTINRNVGIGTAPTQSRLYVHGAYNSGSSTHKNFEVYGQFNYSTTATQIGIAVEARSALGTVGKITCGHFVTRLHGAYTVANAHGFEVQIQSTHASGTMTTARGVSIDTPVTTGTIGTNYGLYIDDQQDYAIYTNSGDVRLGGNVILSGLPTSDPVIADAVWNDGGTLKISAG